MKATCPSCGTSYSLTARQIGPAGRMLQCAKCKHKWFMAPLPNPTGKTAFAKAENDEVPPLPPSALPGLDELASIGSGPRWWRQLRVAWGPELTLTLAGIGVAVLAVACFNWLLGYTPPEDVSDNTGVGFTTTHQPGPQPAGLVLSNLSREISQQGADAILIIRGNVTNATTSTATLPDLRVQLLDNGGVELDYWPVSYVSDTLGPKQQTSWQVSFVNPPLARVAAYRAFFANGGKVSAPISTLDTKAKQE